MRNRCGRSGDTSITGESLDLGGIALGVWPQEQTSGVEDRLHVAPKLKLTGVQQQAAAGPEWNEARATHAVARAAERRVRPHGGI